MVVSLDNARTLAGGVERKSIRLRGIRPQKAGVIARAARVITAIFGTRFIRIYPFPIFRVIPRVCAITNNSLNEYIKIVGDEGNLIRKMPGANESGAET